MGGDNDRNNRKNKDNESKISLTTGKGDVNNLSSETEDDQAILKGINILVVEDNVMNRYIANRSLTRFGCTSDEAENGLIALELVKEKHYDLILMDIQLPKLDGVETTKVIRNEMKLDIPIIALTADAIKKDIDHYLSIGMNDYLTKPFKEKALFNIIAKQLKRYPSPLGPEANKKIQSSYDLTQLKALSGGDETFVSSMIEIFLQHTPAALEGLQNGLSNKDYASIAKITHRIKPSTKTIGINQLDSAIRDIELSTKFENVDHAMLSEKVGLVVDTLTLVLERLRKDHS